MDAKLILLVEDNPDDEFLCLDALATGGLDTSVAVARDGAEALEFLLGSASEKNKPVDPVPHPVLLDLKLPKVSGLEVLRRIRSSPRTRRVPVVVLTSSTEESDLESAYDCGANSYIPKPVEFYRFTDVVKTLGLYWLLFNRVPALEQ